MHLRSALLPAALLALLAVLLVSAAPSAAQAPDLKLTMDAPPPMLPGGEDNGTLVVEYCYANARLPAEVEVTATGPSWLTTSLEPDRFTTRTSGPSCQQQTIAVHLQASRATPAFKPESLALHSTTTVAGDTKETDHVVPVQGLYAAELAVEPPPRVTVKRGEAGVIRLPIGVGANGGTSLEVTGQGDAAGRITVAGKIVTTAAGQGLDAVDRITVPLDVGVSPGAEPGVHKVALTVITKYAPRTEQRGAEATVQGEVEVLTAGSPGPDGAAAGLALAGAAVLAAARLKRGAR